MSTVRFTTLDVFTTERFQGNQLGLVHVPLNSTLTQDQKQAIAKEINYSESVFLHEQVKGDDYVRVDIFTPSAELPFAGHPTIGTLCYIGQESGRNNKNGNSPIPIKLALKAGPINAIYDPSTFSAAAVVPHDVHIHSNNYSQTCLISAHAGLEAHFSSGENSLRDGFDVVSIVKGMTFAMVQLPDLESLGLVDLPRTGPAVELDAGWETICFGEMFFVESSSSGGGTRRYRTRMMEANVGEDAATGSASCALAVYLSLQRGNRDGKYAFEFEQGVEMGRRSVIGVNVELDSSGRGVKEVELRGSAITVMRGEIYL